MWLKAEKYRSHLKVRTLVPRTRTISVPHLVKAEAGLQACRRLVEK